MSPQGLVLVQEQSLSAAGPFPNLPHPQSMGSFVVSVSCMGTWSWIHSKSWEYPQQGANSSSSCCPCLSLLCPLDGSLPSALTCLCVLLPSFAQEFQAGLSSPWLFPTAHLKEHCLRLSPNLCPSGLVAAALVVQGGSCGTFPAVLVLALPRTRLCSRPSWQEFPLSPWQPMKSPGHRMCLCTFCWGRRGEGAELCSASSALVFPAFLVPPPRS